MRRVVLITGQLRSGTSLVAQLCHRLGYQAGVLIAPPAPPRWQSDWEDWQAYEMLIALAPWGKRPTDHDRGDFSRWFGDYLDRRLKVAGFIDQMAAAESIGIACKSPLYAMFIPEIEAAAADRGFELRFIECRRFNLDRSKSLLDTHGRLGDSHLAEVLKTDALIEEGLKVLSGHLRIDRDKIVSGDGLWDLAAYLGITDRARIEAAALCIDRS